jgi:two-component system, OmpR family, response regulator RpaA
MGRYELRQVYTSGQAAKLLGVPVRTVNRWFDRGRLAGYRVPSSNERRIPRTDLEAFAAAAGVPPPAAE